MLKNISKAKRIVILGGGESGVGAAVLAKDKGKDVFLSDSGKLRADYRKILEDEKIEFEDGHHTPEKILNADIIVKSPGIPPTVPLIKQLEEKGVPILSEIEYAAGFTDSKMVCITGSNGKTTTTLLTYHILRKGGLDVGLAGNVGKSLALQVARDPHDVYVIELSSFQLENMYQFKANIAVILNITPDHLDRYENKMENYAAAKFRILRNQTKDDYFIYWQDDPMIRKQIESVQGEAYRLPFGLDEQKETAAYLDNGIVRFSTPTDIWEIPRDKISLPGLHNLYNSMAAGLSATVLNIRKESIREALEDFEAVEHRLEYVGTLNGVRYVNDSKATNVNSTWYALESMDSPVVLIIGGKDKGNDYTEIEPLVRNKVKAIVAMGLHNEKIIDFFKGKVPVIKDTHSLQDAMDACMEVSSYGDTVLLSPCCASFDLFTSYEDRGVQFKTYVRQRIQQTSNNNV